VTGQQKEWQRVEFAGGCYDLQQTLDLYTMSAKENGEPSDD
jgi:hypothetical protein